MTIPQGQALILQYTILNTAVDPPAPLDLTGKDVVGVMGWTFEPQIVLLEIDDGIVINSDPTTGQLTATLRGEDTDQVSSRLGRLYRFELWVIDGGVGEMVDAFALRITDSLLVELS